MNKKLVPVIVLVLALAAGGYYLKMKKSPTSMVLDNQTPTQTNSEASEFAKAIQSGNPSKCTMAKGDDNMEYTIKGKLMLMKANTTVKDDAGKSTTMLSNMINDGQYLYMWQDGQKQGTKMTIPTEEEAKEMSDKAKQYQQSSPKFEDEADYQGYKDQGYTINCVAGIVEDSAFLPPKDVNFIDPTAMMKEITTPGGNVQINMDKIKQLQEKYNGVNE